VTTHPSATRQLKMVLDELRKARGGQRGKLPSVQTMAASSRKRSPEARVNPRTSRRVNLWRISDRGYRLDALTVGHLDVDHGGLQVGMPQQGSRGAECAVWSLRRRW
jgi:hypothetical protein